MHCYGLIKQLCSWASYIEKELQQKNQQLKLLKSLTAKLEKEENSSTELQHGI